MEFSSLFLLLPVLIVGFLYLSKARAGNVRRLPPGPRGLPVIGNLHQVGALPRSPTAPCTRSPRRTARPTSCGSASATSPRWSPPPRPPPRRSCASTTAPFATRPYFRTADILTYGLQDLVFAPHGEHWRHVRRLCSAHVLSAARSHRYNGARERLVAVLVQNIRDHASSSPGAVVDVSKALYGFANEVICRAVSGRVYRADECRNELFREPTEESMALLGVFWVGDYFPEMAWADEALSGAGARARRNLNRWDELLEKLLDEHVGQLGGDGGDDAEEDFVDVLLALQSERQEGGFELTRDKIKSLVADMFAAGTETSYIALEWAMSELVKNPATMQKLQREVLLAAPAAGGSVAGADALGAATTPYLRAVVKETLRLHPPAPLLLPRECVRDVSVLGFHVARGTRLFVNAWAVNRDRASWRSPDEFWPERFLAGSEEAVVDLRGAHFQFVPFGAGRRICPGMQFGLATVELALSNLVRLFDWELPGGAPPGELDMSEAPGLNTPRRVPLRLVAKPFG